MHLSALPPATIRALAFRFVAMCLAMVMVMQATRWSLHALSGSSFPYSAVNGLGPFFAAMATGAFWYERYRIIPASGAAWKMALICTALSVLLEGALFSVSWWSGVQVGFFPPGGPAIAPWKAALAFFGLQVINFLVIRFTLGAGAQQARRRAKG